MVVKNQKFSAYVEGFTTSTYIMIVVSDQAVEQEAISMNIKATRDYFESLVKSSYNAAQWLDLVEEAIEWYTWISYEI